MVDATNDARRVPAHFLLAHEAPEERTLISIFKQTVYDYPQAAAIDDGEILTYLELWEAVENQATHLQSLGIRRGDRIGIQMSSGKKELYIAILAVLKAGAAYVPVDADDPPERAEVVFGEAKVNAIITDDGPRITATTSGNDTHEPQPQNDAWIIFTSGSTGTPKGVAVTHRNAAAFVDAESQLFLTDAPLGPEDRVLAGLSVAFDASCEEMWLAWAHGACLVPAPRSLVRSGMDLGPWLIRRSITVISTVPTLAGLWPAEALDQVRLLIFGGEACPAELVEKVATADREVWNTYGPTESTVVSCATRVYPKQPVSIGLPLIGWDLAVVDDNEQPVAYGEVGELIIGGVGLARYLDPAKDNEKYAPVPSLGWTRAYRSGDHVRLEKDGLYFVGRVDDQVKIGGRRIELGEVEAKLQAIDNINSCCVVAKTTAGQQKVLVGYVSLINPEQALDNEHTQQILAQSMPQALVPQLCVLDELPMTTAGKVDKKALPWPLPTATVSAVGLSATEQWLAQLWVDTLGVTVTDNHADFFSLGGTSLAAATLVGQIRQRYPTLSVRDLYDHPRLEKLAEYLDSLSTTPVTEQRLVRPVPLGTRIAQALIHIPIATVQATPWLVVVLLLHNLLSFRTSQPVPWGMLAVLILIFVSPLGRLPLGGYGARLITYGITPGTYPRGGKEHLQIWAAERLTDASGSRSISGATWVNIYARLLGAKLGSGVDLHSLPPVTGLLSIGDQAAIEPEVDLSGYWIDGDRIHVGAIEIGANARIGTRSTLLPGSVIGANAHVEAGATVTGTKAIKANSRWAGSPAKKVGRSKYRFPQEPPSRRSRWIPIYGGTAVVLFLLPLLALAAGGGVMLLAHQRLTGHILYFAPVGALVAFATYMAVVVVLVRLLSIKLADAVLARGGVFPVRSTLGWRIWLIERLMDDARTFLFPLYAAQLTPWWLRLLGAKVGSDAEISTALLVPALVEIRDGSFLADDTLIGGYELSGGWMRIEPTKIGKRGFVGNSGIAGAGRKLSKNSLVAVLSSTPKKTKAGSNWWGSPPERMRRVTVAPTSDEARTYKPGLRVKCARGVLETLRLLAPMTSATLGAGFLWTLHQLYISVGLGVTWLLSGVVLTMFGILALVITAVMKWLCVGKHRVADHLLWSPFVWLNELQDAFVEVVAAPWFFNPQQGTGLFNAGLRLLGVRLGSGAWVESYWFPETDLCHIGKAASIGPGTVIQTHLFQDRVMSLGTVSLADGATLGAHSVVLPAAVIGENTVIEPGSLVMRGDQVPPHSRWQGNPIEPKGD